MPVTMMLWGWGSWMANPSVRCRWHCCWHILLLLEAFRVSGANIYLMYPNARWPMSSHVTTAFSVATLIASSILVLNRDHLHDQRTFQAETFQLNPVFSPLMSTNPNGFQISYGVHGHMRGWERLSSAIDNHIFNASKWGVWLLFEIFWKGNFLYWDHHDGFLLSQSVTSSAQSWESESRWSRGWRTEGSNFSCGIDATSAGVLLGMQPTFRSKPCQ